MKTFKRTVLVLLVAGLVYGLYYLSRALPILVGYGAKDLCSCVWVGGRTPADVIANELGQLPLKLGSFTVDFNDSSASASVMGMVSKKAIYRKGLGCTLISEISEQDLRRQRFSLASPPVINTDTTAWPNGDRLSAAQPGNIDVEKINRSIENAFTEPGETKRRNIRAVVVVYDGQIIAEKYAPGFTVKSKHHGWSMTKSLTNAWVGIMVGEGKLRTDDPAPVSVWQGDDRKNITLNNLLQATSGLHWREVYAGPSEATGMLFRKKDMGLYAEQQPLEENPGRKFRYSSGTPNIISRILREKIGDGEYYQYPYQKLFYRIGMYSAVLEPDAGGSFVASSYSFATARDWARFGLLYLNDGMWNGQRVLPEGWVHYTTTPAKAAPIGEYGALFWLNAGADGNPEHRRYPDAPTDVFGADGYEGQNIWVLPSKKLVIVRLSQEQGNYLDENKFIADIAGAVPSLRVTSGTFGRVAPGNAVGKH